MFLGPMHRIPWDASRGLSTTLNKHKNNFYDRFWAFLWLQHKIINCCIDGIMGQFRWWETPGMHYKSCRPHRKVFSEK